MHRGYTKRWRKRWDNGYHKDVLLWIMMDYFIDYANWKDNEFPFIWKGKLVEMVKVKRGECFFTFKGLADFLNSSKNKVSRKMVRERINILQKIEFLAHKKGHQYQIVTILNYDKYNPLKENECHQSEHQSTINLPPICHQSTTPNKDNKDKNKKNNTYQKIYDFYVSEINPKQKSKTRALKNIERWHKKHSYDDLIQAIKNYQSVCNGRDSEHKKDPANFFGVNEVFHIDYLSENFIKTDTAPQAIQAGDTSIYDN